jgi:hypothetical protein
MSEHEQQADRLEHEADDMEQRSERLGEQIGDTREDWERKQRDGGLPGATGEPRPSDDEREPWHDE